MCPYDNTFSGSEGEFAEVPFHESVMVREILEYLDPQPGETLLDCTLGDGGHALAISERLGPTGRLLGIDQDAQAIGRARRRLHGHPATLVHENFRHLDNILRGLSVARVDGVLFDLGVSALQLTAAERGFSFRFEAPLDMRMDHRLTTTAADVINRLGEEEMVRLFLDAGYGRWARRLARAITQSRQRSPITTTKALAETIAAALPARGRGRIHPATKAFMVLRTVVNQEIAALSEALAMAVHYTRVGGRIVTVSYHSIEDGVVKRTFRRLSGERLPTDPYEPEPPAAPRLLRVLTRKPVTPSAEEVERNPRARSAKLRAAERVAP